MRQLLPTGPLAIDPRAIGEFLIGSERDQPPADVDGEIALISVDGPLMDRVGPIFCSYEEIVHKANVAVEQGAKTIVLDIDSPGGMVQGCFDAVRDLRALSKRSGVRIVAYARKALSAGFALACAAEVIYSGAESPVCHIGVISARTDVTAAMAENGVKTVFITSGARKADGNAELPITEDELLAEQKHVNELAGSFFELVSDARGVPVDTVRALEANRLTGARAKELGLVDGVMTFTEAMAAFKGSSEKESSEMGWMAQLKAAAEAGDADAKKALAAVSAESEEEDEASSAGEGAAAESEEEDEASSAGEGAAAESEEEDEDDEEASSALSAVAKHPAFKALSAEVAALKAEREAEKIAAKKKELLASRPDFTKETLAELQNADLATIKFAVKSFPKGKPVNPAASELTGAATPTEGAHAGGEGSGLDPYTAAKMDAAIGGGKLIPKATFEGNTLRLSMTREKK